MSRKNEKTRKPKKASGGGTGAPYTWHRTQPGPLCIKEIVRTKKQGYGKKTGIKERRRS